MMFLRQVMIAISIPLFVVASQGQALDPQTGDVNVKWDKATEPLAGPGRKFYAGDRLTITVDGEYTRHDSRPERHCDLWVICKDVDVPDPHKFEPSTDPVQILFEYYDGSGSVPGLPAPLTVSSPVDQIIPGGDAAAFAKAIRLKAWIAGATRREISTGTYRLTITVDSGERVQALRSYLNERARKESELRSPDVLNERLRQQHPEEIAQLLAEHATKYYSGSKDPVAMDQYPLIVKLAQTITPGSSSLYSALAAHYIDSGEFVGAEQNALDVLKNATNDDEHASAFENFGMLTERKTSGLQPGSLSTAASYYSQALEAANRSSNRSLQIRVSLAQAATLRKTRSIPSLLQASKLLEQARRMAPSGLKGNWGGALKDGRSFVLWSQDVGFYVGSGNQGSDQQYHGSPGESWVLLATRADGKVLVARDRRSVDWYDPETKSLEHVGGAEVDSAISKRDVIFARAGISLVIYNGSLARTVFVSKPPTVALPATGSIPWLIALSDDAKTYAFVTNLMGNNGAPTGQRITVETLAGSPVRTIDLSGFTTQLGQIGLTPDGLTVIAIAAVFVPDGKIPPLRKILVWPPGATAPTTVLGSDGQPFATTMDHGPGDITFDGRSNHAYVTDGQSLLSISTTDWKVDKVVGVPTDSIDLGVIPRKPTYGHKDLPDGRLLIFPKDMIPNVPLKLVLYNPADSTMSSSPYEGGFSSGQVIMHRGVPSLLFPAVKMNVNIVSTETGASLRRKEYESVVSDAWGEVLPAGRILVRRLSSRTPPELLAYDFEQNASATVFKGVAGPTSQYANGEWQVFELGANFQPQLLHVFNGITEEKSFAVPAVPANSVGIYAAGGGCSAPPVGPGFPSVATWFPITNYYPTINPMFAPSPFVTLFGPPTNELVDFPVLQTQSAASPDIKIKTGVKCGRFLATSSTIDASLFQIVNPGPDRIVISTSLPNKRIIPLFPTIPKDSQHFMPNTFGYFSEDGRTLVAGYTGVDTKLGVWSFDSGDAVPMLCASCDSFDSNTLKANAVWQNGLPPTFSFVLAASGKQIAVVTKKSLELLDLSTNQVKVKLPLQVPLNVDDKAAVTMEAAGRVLLWTY